MKSALSILGVLASVAGWLLFAADGDGLRTGSRAAIGSFAGFPELRSYKPLPELAGEMCQWLPASASAAGFGFLRERALTSRPASAPQAEERATGEWDRSPVRVIRDSYATYSAVAVDLDSGEVYLQDENLFGFKVFNRLDNTPPTAAFTEPKRIVAGINTKMEFNCGLYVDPASGDVYSVANDSVDTLVVFPRDARGNVAPKRELSTPHGTFGIAVDEARQELYLTVQHSNSVVAYRKMAAGDEKPLRTLQGPSTQLEDPHGIALDTKNGWLFVSNHGHARREPISDWDSDATTSLDRQAIARTGGYFEPPSITVYPWGAKGNTAPLGIIEGPRTQLNWPAAMAVDSERGELFVSNDVGDSILVFRTSDSGNVAPRRFIRGPKTGISNPTGVFADTKNQELWVANMGNHSATVFPLLAHGDVAPLRTIRSAPLGKKALGIGNPGAVAYDSKRNEILVPN
ncbi:MAG: hypothetical protein HYX72_01455 [Acidobacteria bacterium]|nr:hypothetical protein [Acidobacteriota bacterium]